MNMEKTLKGQVLFSSLSPDEISSISRISVAKSFAQGDQIYRHEGRVSHLFLLLDGVVHLRIPAEQGQLTLVLGKVVRGELFGVAALLGYERYTATAIAAEPAEVLAIEIRPLQEMLKANRAAALAFTGQAAQVYYTRYIDLMRAFRKLQTAISGMGLIR